ncbi:MAG: hypothetical protein LBQ76_02820 [Candidatus Fibromonas sp.]|jgi:YD repeat-containing protein|nr:hypothetical protein [Candidatus Fibromonas sp.]
MSKTVSKLALTASVVLAMAFTFSCSGDDGGGGGKEVIDTISSTIVSYDASGAVTGNSTIRWEYEYDSKGNRIKTFIYDADGNRSVSEYEYDSRGNPVKEIRDGTIAFEYDCNSDGSFCTYIAYSGGDISGTGEIRYTTINSKRLEASRTITLSNGLVTITEYEYDSKGNTTKLGYMKYENHEYDSRGNVTRLTGYSQQADGSYVKFVEQTYTYTYKTI